MEKTGKSNHRSIDITCFTDPLCCWSWGLQPHLERLQALYGERITLQYKMGGMLPSWQQFYDEANAVSRPVQMGPVWMHAAQLTGRPINHHLWVKDPPASSFPACIAVKSAALQSPEAGVACFKQLQEAALAQGKNIAAWPVIHAVAQALVAVHPSFDVEQFAVDYKGAGMEAFRADRELAAQYRITRFPTLIITAAGHKSILLSGYRTGDGIIRAVEQAFPGWLQEVPTPSLFANYPAAAQ